MLGLFSFSRAGDGEVLQIGSPQCLCNFDDHVRGGRGEPCGVQNGHHLFEHLPLKLGRSVTSHAPRRIDRERNPVLVSYVRTRAQQLRRARRFAELAKESVSGSRGTTFPLAARSLMPSSRVSSS